MPFTAREASERDVLALRTRYRAEMNCQIVHDSIHRREGWTVTYRLTQGPAVAGFGSMAIGGPWKGKPAIFEFYVLPEFRCRVFDCFEALLTTSGATHFEAQSNDVLLAVMVQTYGREVAGETIVFRDGCGTFLPAGGATIRCVTPDEEIRRCFEQRQGGGDWLLDVDRAVAGKGGILFHYNHPYGDIYMEIDEPFRQRGLGSYLVQELKRACYGLGAIPCARCNATNVPSRRTLQRAGFVPFAHILTGTFSVNGSRS